MPHHVIVDGSNLATEGRTLPSLNQLNEAIASYRSDHPEALITVVVDATFGHRIDASESAEFERAIETNAFVAPPAGAVGRGDGFILSIAQKVGAVILSNDSYQEFHGEYAWLFDQGRLVGGKPVPHVGWVFVDRVPVRGPVSRRSVKEQKVVEKSPTRARRGRTAAGESLSADAPMPVPTLPPPGGVLRQKRSPSVTTDEQSSGTPQRGSVSRPNGPAAESSTVDKVVLDKALHAKAANDLMPFITFVQHHPVGSAVSAVVDHYSSHGAYVLIDDVVAYVPLRLMAEPAPRSAREIMGVGDTVSLVVHSFTPGRRSIDLATPAMAPAPLQKQEPAKARRAGTQRAPIVAGPDETVTTAARRRRTSKSLVIPDLVTVTETPQQEDPVAKRRPARQSRPSSTSPVATVAEKVLAKPKDMGSSTASIKRKGLATNDLVVPTELVTPKVPPNRKAVPQPGAVERPKPTSKSKVTAGPKADLERKANLERKARIEPKATVAPKATVVQKAIVERKATVARKATVEPDTTAKLKATARPKATAKPTPTAAPGLSAPTGGGDPTAKPRRAKATTAKAVRS